MDILDEYYQTTVFRFSSEEFVNLLQRLIIKKEEEILLIKDKIIKYEEKRRTHEAWYQSLSTFKKLFAGRPPIHHQAVEYLVNVKQRFQNIEEIKKRIADLNKIIDLVRKEPNIDQFVLSQILMDEIKRLIEVEGIRQ